MCEIMLCYKKCIQSFKFRLHHGSLPLNSVLFKVTFNQVLTEYDHTELVKWRDTTRLHFVKAHTISETIEAVGPFNIPYPT